VDKKVNLSVFYKVTDVVVEPASGSEVTFNYSDKVGVPGTSGVPPDVGGTGGSGTIRADTEASLASKIRVTATWEEGRNKRTTKRAIPYDSTGTLNGIHNVSYDLHRNFPSVINPAVPVTKATTKQLTIMFMQDPIGDIAKLAQFSRKLPVVLNP
jgi:hypothetical protein